MDIAERIDLRWGQHFDRNPEAPTVLYLGEKEYAEFGEWVCERFNFAASCPADGYYMGMRIHKVYEPSHLKVY